MSRERGAFLYPSDPDPSGGTQKRVTPEGSGRWGGRMFTEWYTVSHMQKVIGIDAHHLAFKERTGVEQYAYNVIRELRKVIPATHRVVLYSHVPLAPHISDWGALPPNWENRVLAWPPRRLWTQLRLSWEMLRKPPDLLFVPAHALPIMLPKCAITTMHDVAFMPHPEAYTPWGNLYLRVDAWLATRRASILTPSAFSKSEIVRYFGADPARITVTPLAYDAALYHPAPSEAIADTKKRHGIDGSYFIFVGRRERKKNLSGMLKAFRAFKATRPADDTTKLVLVGKRLVGYAREMREVRGTPLMGSILELGYVSQQDIPALYSGAIATVLTSWYEGFGLPVIEGYACGTPAIVSDRTSLPEVAGDGALYADPSKSEDIAAAMTRLADDATLRARLAVEGVERATAFSWGACARQTWESMERALS